MYSVLQTVVTIYFTFPGNLESSGEGAYFEDDYITDYSVKEDVDFLEESGYNSSSVIREMELEEEDYQNNHSYDNNNCQQVIDEQDGVNLSSSAEFKDDRKWNKDNIEAMEGLMVMDIKQTANSTVVSLKDNRQNENDME